MTNPLTKKLVLKLETEGKDGEPIVVERKLTANWESMGPMLTNDLVEVVDVEGKNMLSELIAKCAK